MSAAAIASTSSATTGSTSASLWAAASKEWVIPSKPKPGRKPKKDQPAQPTGDQPSQSDTKERRVQNRAAQRAFRERKQSQLADLQARIRQYEHGEIQRSVALQEIAKRLKEENENLRRENTTLLGRVAELEARLQSQIVVQHSPPDKPEKKRHREATSANARKKQRTRPADASSQRSSSVAMSPSVSTSCNVGQPIITPFSYTSTASPPSLVSSDTAGTPFSSFDDAADELADNLGNKSSNHLNNSDEFKFDCGFCNDDMPCVCREIAMHSELLPEPLIVMDSASVPRPTYLRQPSTFLSTPPTEKQSILDNLPPYQPAVPLPKLSSRNANQARFIFPIFPAESSAAAVSASPKSSSSTSQPMCSGDPSNCMACAGDTFGRAFCAALRECAGTVPPCDDCPGTDAYCRNGGNSPRNADAAKATVRGPASSTAEPATIEPALDPNSACCIGDTNLCVCSGLAESSAPSPTAQGALPDVVGSSVIRAAPSAIAASSLSSSRPSAAPPRVISQPSTSSHTDNTWMPTNEAWHQIKAHPNVEFADLAMLADVVARRSKCTGPTVVIEPPLGATTPERVASPLRPSTCHEDPKPGISSSESDPRQETAKVMPPFRSQQPPDSERPRLVPQEVLRACGRRGIREVEVAAVRDALRLLDAKFA
ncbi:hypothetical protein FISHEDRAFT_76673 [Fistulina hepatica ATCC 64428]|uniref:BZIP domain-containing protein n=1 Tax=Fistulina hepatica ATCC 64428 TaxID=1128425 RepID=A0A0D7A533_9AGAR|nr:hypothetical protein FISHEDRAFT_76673 [Fistulina hepatica ATCC 64428]